MDSNKPPTGVARHELVSSMSTQCWTKNVDPTKELQMNTRRWQEFVKHSRDSMDESGFSWVDMKELQTEIQEKQHLQARDSDSDMSISNSDLSITPMGTPQPSNIDTTNGNKIKRNTNNTNNTNSTSTNNDTPVTTTTTKTATTFTSTTNTSMPPDFLDSLSQIAYKFDVLFPFYRLSDKDCKKLSLFVYENLNNINKIFCISKGRYLEAYVYYYGNNKMRQKFTFFNNDDPDNEVSTWNDIIMDNNYCKRELSLETS